jgi:hypothetical protein
MFPEVNGLCVLHLELQGIDLNPQVVETSPSSPIFSLAKTVKLKKHEEERNTCWKKN